jgi:WD40 repeat protein
MDGTVRLWPLRGDAPPPGRVLFEKANEQVLDIAKTPDGDLLLVGTDHSGAHLLSLSGGESRIVPDIGPGVYGATISPDGRLAAGKDNCLTPEVRVRVWDLATGEALMTFRPNGRGGNQLQFTDDGHLLSSTDRGLQRWNLETGESEVLYDGNLRVLLEGFSANRDGTKVVMAEREGVESSASRRAVFLDYKTGISSILARHGTRISAVMLGAEGDVVVTGDSDGVVRVGRASGEEPHLLLGHESAIATVAIDPLGRWLASGSYDNTIRLWPMPDLSKPPLHTLPHDELIAKLETLTNLRVVRDEESSTGWTLEVGPFPGWETVPTW